MSCIFMLCKLVRHFHVRHFQRPLFDAFDVLGLFTNSSCFM